MRRADNATGNAFPGQRFIAKEISMTPSTVTKAITDLEDRGWLEVTRERTAKNENRVNHYLVRTSRGGVPNTGTPVPESGTGGVPESGTELDEDLTRTNELQVARPRDLLWESFVEVHGQPATKSERGKFNRIVANLKQADVTPTEYPILCQGWKAKHGLEPGPATVSERVGEIRHFVAKGPIVAPTKREVTRHTNRQRTRDAIAALKETS